MPLRERIEYLLQLDDRELTGPYAVELEDAIQCGFAAVHAGELWISQVQRALEEARGHDPERVAALEREAASARAVVEAARAQMALLHARAQELGVGAPRR